MRWPCAGFDVCSTIVDVVFLIFTAVSGFFIGMWLGRVGGFEYSRPLKPLKIPDRSPADLPLFDEVKIFCWVTTKPSNFRGKCEAVMNTWGRDCNRIIFVSNETDDVLPVLVFEGEEFWRGLSNKTQKALKWIYGNVLNQYEWFLKADDDTYVHMTNLRHLLRKYSPNKALAFGHKYQKPNSNYYYHSGGAGYAISRRGVQRIVKDGLLGGNCSAEAKVVTEDVFVGKCLSKLGATVMDGADENGAHRFFPVAVWDYLHQYRLPPWLNRTSVTKLKPSYSCCSPHFMAMNYAANNLEYLADYLLHRLRPFGAEFQ
ncbi:hypothetical protein Q1695_016010 [Nippostrongylus brasiliensis]|nr:hypothetical protein Q1695_016010 [Nippostrongylus brasiliensis]